MKKNNKLRNFTLIEILIVIAIIAILVAILMPTVTKIFKRAKETRAKAEMQSIITAIKSYESTYGLLPIPASWTNPENSGEYDDLMELLTDVKIGGGAPTTYRNSRQIRFLDVPEGYTANGYVDPWGNKYYITLDTDYDGAVSGVQSESANVYGNIFIYSDGAGGGAADYVYSWK